jgi:hypothetical protein
MSTSNDTKDISAVRSTPKGQALELENERDNCFSLPLA